jgi:hypothetical protein
MFLLEKAAYSLFRRLVLPFTVSSSETEVFLAEETAFSSVSFSSTFWDIKEAKIELEIRVLSKEEEQSVDRISHRQPCWTNKCIPCAAATAKA